MGRENHLEVKDLRVNYGSIKAVKAINLKVPVGSIVTLIGSNGAGKTTTLSAISGLVKPTSGQIVFDGKVINGTSPNNVNRMGISLVPEGRKIFSSLTVRENLLMGAYARKNKDEIEKDLDKVFELFPRMKERINQSGGTLSGGEQQMLAIGRALMAKPKLIMMDEPSLGLAPIIVEEVFNVIRRLNKTGVTILLVEQNAASALKVSDYSYVVETGKVILEGPASEMLSNDQVKKAYLGI